MDRRRFLLTSLAGAFAGPPDAEAQQAVKVPTIGLLGSGTAAAQRQWTGAFVQRLRELGWNEGRNEGRNVAIEYRRADGRNERFAEITGEFVRLKVDLILTHNTPEVHRAARRANLGDEPGGDRLDVYFHPGGAPWRMS